MTDILRRRYVGVFGVALALLPALLYLVLAARCVSNIPRGDDYLAVIQYLCDWVETPSVSARFSSLFAQYFSHRIVVTKVILAAQLFAIGSCDFRWLMAFGFISWLGLAVWITLRTPAARVAPWFALPVALLLMQPQGYTNLHVGMQSPQNLGIVLIAFAALAGLLNNARNRFAGGLVLGGIAPFVSANGLLVLPVAAISLLVLRRWRRAAIAAAATLLFWAAYFSGFVADPTPFRPVDFLLYAAVMTGGPFELARTPLPVIAVLGTLLLLLAAIFLGLRRSWKTLPLHTAFLLFLLMTIALAARGRIGWDASYMLQDRYRLYGLLVLAVGYLLILELAPPARRRRIWLFAVPTCFAFSFFSYATYLPVMAASARWAEATAINRQLGQAFLLPSGPGWKEPLQALARADQLGIYRFPRVLSEDDLATLRALPVKVSPTSPRLYFTPNGAVIGNVITVGPAQANLPAPDFAVLTTDERRLVLPVDIWRTRLPDLVHRLSFFSESFGLICPEEAYRPGPTAVAVHGIVRAPDGRLAVAWSAHAEVSSHSPN